jgi:hypothetical protein
MRCQKCDQKLKIVRTVDAGPVGKTQEAVCGACGARFTAVTLLVSPLEGRGSGPQALASRLKRGELTLEAQDGQERPAEGGPA